MFQQWPYIYPDSATTLCTAQASGSPRRTLCQEAASRSLPDKIAVTLCSPTRCQSSHSGNTSCLGTRTGRSSTWMSSASPCGLLRTGQDALFRATHRVVAYDESRYQGLPSTLRQVPDKTQETSQLDSIACAIQGHAKTACGLLWSFCRWILGSRGQGRIFRIF